MRKKMNKKQLEHYNLVLKHVEIGNLITHTRCMGVIEEHYFTGWDGKWMCGKPTKETKKYGGEKTNDISPLNITHINRELVENLDFSETLKNYI
jgi:hypothetical protein